MADLATQFPTYPSFQTVNFKINTPSLASQTLSGKFRRVGMNVSYYTWEVKYSNLMPIDAGTVLGYTAQAFGPQFSFEIILPKISYTRIYNQTTSQVRTAAQVQIGATSILIQTANNANVLGAGDFFKFNNHSKVYQCVSPCVADGAGRATLYFSGPAVAFVENNTQLTITAVPFTAVLAEDTQEFETGVGGITSLGLTMREVW